MSCGEDLAMEAVKLLAGTAIRQVGKPIVRWIRSRLRSNEEVNKAADMVLTDPDSPAAKKILEGHLQVAMEKHPPLAEELRTILDHAGVRHATQTAHAHGGSTIKQIQGNNNRA